MMEREAWEVEIVRLVGEVDRTLARRQNEWLLALVVQLSLGALLALFAVMLVWLAVWEK